MDGRPVSHVCLRSEEVSAAWFGRAAIERLRWRPTKAGLRGLTISVYLPRRDVNQGAQNQTRRINLVGLNRRPEDGLVGAIGVCQLGVRGHAQFMT